MTAILVVQGWNLRCDLNWLQGFTVRHGKRLWRSSREKSHHSSAPNSFFGTRQKLGLKWYQIAWDRETARYKGGRTGLGYEGLGFHLKIKGLEFRV